MAAFENGTVDDVCDLTLCLVCVYACVSVFSLVHPHVVCRCTCVGRRIGQLETFPRFHSGNPSRVRTKAGHTGAAGGGETREGVCVCVCASVCLCEHENMKRGGV